MKNEDLSTATRLKILDAASKVIMEKGTEAFTLDAVAQEAAVSKGGLLYHFPSKKQLIQGMIESMIARVDATLAEELARSGGDFLTAYIRASFQTKTGPRQISYALFAAISNDPDLLEPLRARFFRMQRELTAAAATEEQGTLIRLALDGLWFSDLFGFAPPPPELREKMLSALLAVVQGSDPKQL
jgi:AcrR family transcriptional regulator